MLSGLLRMLRGRVAGCRLAAGENQMPRHFSVAQRCQTDQSRDYALPNPSWSPNTRELYDKFLTLSKAGTWRRLPSHNAHVHHKEGIFPDTDRRTRLFTRNLDQEGVGFEYCMFYNKDEKRMICIFQPGQYLEGPPGYTHGGCIATIIDVTVGTGVLYSSGRAMTANLNIDFRNPIPLGSTVLIESQVEKVDGRKVYATCKVRSHDNSVLHTEATALFIRMNFENSEAKL